MVVDANNKSVNRLWTGKYAYALLLFKLYLQLTMLFPAMTIATKYFSHHYDVLGSSIHQKYSAWDLILQYAFHLECRYSLLVDLL